MWILKYSKLGCWTPFIYIYIGKYCQLLVVGTIYNDLEKNNKVHEKHVIMDFVIFLNFIFFKDP